ERVDEAASPPGGDLELSRPARVQHLDERLEHRRLEPIVDTRPGAGEESDPEAGTKGARDRLEQVEARWAHPLLDPGKVRRIDIHEVCEHRQRDAGIEP